MKLKPQAKNSLRGFVRIALTFTVMIALIGVTYEAIGNYRDERRFPLKAR